MTKTPTKPEPKPETLSEETEPEPELNPPPTDPLKFPTVRPDSPEVGEPPEPTDVPKPETGPTPESARTLVYRGNADTFSFGALRIRPGEPFVTTAAIAEDLLTYPHERFEEVSQE